MMAAVDLTCDEDDEELMYDGPPHGQEDYDEIISISEDEEDASQSALTPEEFPSSWTVSSTTMHDKRGRLILLEAGMTVELALEDTRAGENISGNISGDFLRITDIIQDIDSREFLRGQRLRRVDSFAAILDKEPNEVCMVLHENQEDDRNPMEQSQEDVPLHQFIRKRTLILTNQIFPALSYQPTSRGDTYNHSTLVCRVKYITSYKNARKMKERKIEEFCLERIRQHEADNGYGIADATLKEEWCKRADQMEPAAAHRTEYTFGDGFCGAGGVSRGAKMAGLRIKWAFDQCAVACASYRANFPNARILCKAAHDFISHSHRRHCHVDVMHLSPPCQAFAMCHTRPGKNDEENEAALFSVRDCLKKAHPRITTIEETAGIKRKHPDFLNALIRQFTCQAFSVRWKIMNFAHYGNTQARERLVVIASCPGEQLPHFPARTHCGPGLKPQVTIHDVCSGIPRNAPNSDGDRREDRIKYDPHTPLKSCITTNGGESNHHWSGKRTFTMRELACLQGFPVDHKFVGGKTQVQRQIGNAVPPVVMEPVFREIIRSLEASDREAEKLKEARESMAKTGHTVLAEDDLVIELD
ncbi:hypothetical protein LTR66_007656 [Elasticomyces elasticus]|nr:hypothetical protein LTR66_007656 [Elasticomyces elasticus]KAK5009848.1 hypothetical protein LTR28_013108 [Elasticomyces elasticus]